MRGLVFVPRWGLGKPLGASRPWVGAHVRSKSALLTRRTGSHTQWWSPALKDPLSSERSSRSPRTRRVPSVAVSETQEGREATLSSGERTRGLVTASSVSSAGLELEVKAT